MFLLLLATVFSFSVCVCVYVLMHRRSFLHVKMCLLSKPVTNELYHISFYSGEREEVRNHTQFSFHFFRNFQFSCVDNIVENVERREVQATCL